MKYLYKSIICYDLTLPLGSALTPFVTDAMNAILDDGTVQGLIDTWLKAYTSDIPVLA